MTDRIKKISADVAIVGGGPGGCTMAKDLTQKGKKVVLIEQGGNDTKFFGSVVGLALGGHAEMGKRMKMRKTIEGQTLVMGKGVGGGTKLYQGLAFLPDIDAFKGFDIDLTPYVDAAVKETWTNPIPENFLGSETQLIMETAHAQGHIWEQFLKHIDFNRCEPGCTKCGSGCPKGAKWTGKVPADEAQRNGAILLIHTKVRDVIVENGVAVGVRARGNDGQKYEIGCNAVVCSAGGIGTTPILKRSGLHDVGNWLSGDPSVLMFGFIKESRGHGYEHQMAVGGLDEERGVILSAGLPAPLSTFFLLNFQKVGFRRAFRNARQYGNAIGVWTKIHDDGLGRVYLDGRVSKQYTSHDFDKLDYAKVALEKILIAHGCDPYSIAQTGTVIGHPSGTAPVGKMVDSNLETQIKNLYCCDTSVMPEAPGRPPTLTVVCLAKRLAERLEIII